ncbi:Outer membrane protein A [Beggiatoa sp. PS]|nr:Outer membrane protein A [Beggiatoa sp. PS]
MLIRSSQHFHHPSMRMKNRLPRRKKEQAPIADKQKSKAEDNRITFEPGKATLTDQVKSILDTLAAKICLEIAHINAIVITGHADSSPTDNYKQKLSLARAVAVADYLKSRCPALTDDKLITKGLADQYPLSADSAKNRRVEIRVMKKN